MSPCNSSAENRQKKIGSQNDGNPAEHELDVAQSVHRVWHEPHERERRHEPKPSHERPGVDRAMDEQRIQRKPQRREPHCEETPTRDPATASVAGSEHDNPSRERDQKEIGDAHVDRTERDRVAAEAEHHRCDQAEEAPLRSLRHEEAEGHEQRCPEQRNADRYPVGRRGDDTHTDGDSCDTDAKQESAQTLPRGSRSREPGAER